MALSAVYSCVRLIGLQLGHPICICTGSMEPRERLPSDHPIYQLVNSTPCEHMTAFDFWEPIISDALLHGEGFASIEREEKGQTACADAPAGTADKMRKHTTKGQVTHQHQDMEDHIFPEDLSIIRCFRGKSPITAHGRHWPGYGCAGICFQVLWHQEATWVECSPSIAA